MKRNFNEILREKEQRAAATAATEGEVLRLDDARRVKVLSPARLVTKRFLRNKLAIVGSCILIALFLFCFIGPLFYPYGQIQKFYKLDILENANYATAGENGYVVIQTNGTVDVRLTAAAMESAGSVDEVGDFVVGATPTTNIPYYLIKTDEGYIQAYTGTALGTFTLANKQVALVNTMGQFTFTADAGYETVVNSTEFQELAKSAAFGASFEYDGVTYYKQKKSKIEFTISVLDTAYCVWDGEVDGAYQTPALFETFVEAQPYDVKGTTLVTWNGEEFLVFCDGNRNYKVSTLGDEESNIVLSNLTLLTNTSEAVSDAMTAAAHNARIKGEDTFVYGEKTYSIVEDADGTVYVYDGEVACAEFSTYSMAFYTGEKTVPAVQRDEIQAAIEAMRADPNRREYTFQLSVEKRSEETGEVLRDENGAPLYQQQDAQLKLESNSFEIRTNIIKKQIDINNKPLTNQSGFHLLGTDKDGYDVFARLMYGGRISLIVGFVVVFLECILGIIMGGIAGYFGGWVDALIMRLVDIFYCIPTMPIMIILGAVLDSIEGMNTYIRLVWMMAVLGFLGWAGIARMVRGQILSLREQEFMTAAEATGIRVRRKIFRHLIPNVMPQLIVSATAGLGGIILTESTLSFLGLGVKHPLSTWGTMINSVSSATGMELYTYIWIPVGLLICLAVIAFNFVGDGLRDAFDPKMKR
jgi:peptide/nickel transport system permease protein